MISASLRPARESVGLEIGSHTWSDGGLIFDVSSSAREIALDVHGLDFADARWSSLEEPFIRKAHEIVLSCRNTFGVAPTAPVGRFVR